LNAGFCSIRDRIQLPFLASGRGRSDGLTATRGHMHTTATTAFPRARDSRWSTSSRYWYITILRIKPTAGREQNCPRFSGAGFTKASRSSGSDQVMPGRAFQRIFVNMMYADDKSPPSVVCEASVGERIPVAIW